METNKIVMERLEKMRNKLNKKYSPIKELNRRKVCSNCEEVVLIQMVGTSGYCPLCGLKLYTTDWRDGAKKK